MKIHRVLSRPSILTAASCCAARSPALRRLHRARTVATTAAAGADFHGFRAPPPGPEFGGFPGGGFGRRDFLRV